ncbi:hypothetical protein RvY_16178 [Ramazzottius varieornatus]|uniref:Chitin-binding type-2 domain-containing protein n=1 Tax=Ramazzottius varieornatus TaxID=947166 RepID=A0A1D1VXI7_RAMVA|nr:hypothetical protein RvY_16178 [Ramazzottius varieornatus]
MEVSTVQCSLRLLSLLVSLGSVISSPLPFQEGDQNLSAHQRYRRQLKESELLLREICQIGDGEFRHPMSCNSYLQCKDGMYTEKVCPGNMVYDVYIKACNYKRKVRCSVIDGLTEFYDDATATPSATTSTTTTEEPVADEGSDEPEDAAEEAGPVDETTTPSTTTTTVIAKKSTHIRTKKTASATVFYYRQPDSTTRNEKELTTTPQRTVPRPTIHLSKQEVPRLKLASMEDTAPAIEESNAQEAESKMKIGVVQMNSHPQRAINMEKVVPLLVVPVTQEAVPSLKVIDMMAPAKADEEECVIWEDE